MRSIHTGLVIATAAAAMFALGAPVTAQAGDDATVKCAGINSCKGTSECKAAHNDCKGMNSCKGQGWLKKDSEAECMKSGGTVLKG